MKIAAFVFALAGVVHLALTIGIVVRSGDVHVWSAVAALFAAALLYQGFSLYRATPGARLSGMISAAMLAAACWYVVVILSPPISMLSAVVTADLWVTLGTWALVALAFSSAFVALWMDTRVQ